MEWCCVLLNQGAVSRLGLVLQLLLLITVFNQGFCRHPVSEMRRELEICFLKRHALLLRTLKEEMRVHVSRLEHATSEENIDIAILVHYLSGSQRADNTGCELFTIQV